MNLNLIEGHVLSQSCITRHLACERIIVINMLQLYLKKNYEADFFQTSVYMWYYICICTKNFRNCWGKFCKRQLMKTPATKIVAGSVGSWVVTLRVSQELQIVSQDLSMPEFNLGTRSAVWTHSLSMVSNILWSIFKLWGSWYYLNQTHRCMEETKLVITHGGCKREKSP